MDDKAAGAPTTVASVDLQRYAGRWYEISRFPNRFQDHCTGDVRATYALVENGRMSVVNECRTQSGKTDRAEGVARVVAKDDSNSKLKVRFAPAFLSWLPIVWGDYWIFDLAEDYSFVLVGSPNRDYLWVLARTPVLANASYDRLIQAASARGFDVSRLVKTNQTE